MAKFALSLALLVAGCTATSDPAPSAAPGERRQEAASNQPLHPGKHRPRRRPNDLTASRSLRRSPVVLNWRALANCESGGNPRAVDPTGRYFGLYQFLVSTFAAVGGHGNPADASPFEQTYRAELLYARAGSSPWPTCGYLLYSGGAS